jgi:hypothetical protein
LRQAHVPTLSPGMHSLSPLDGAQTVLKGLKVEAEREP